MQEPTENSPQSPSTLPVIPHEHRLETILRLVGGVAIAAYVAGFFVVGMYQAHYGIYELDLLRPRVAAAGIAFMAMLVLAALGARHHFGNRPLPPGFWSLDRMQGATWAVNVARAAALYPAFLLLTMAVPLIAWMFDFSPQGGFTYDRWDVAVVGFSLAVFFVPAADLLFPVWPWASILSVWTLCGTVFALAWFDRNDVRVLVAAWLTAAGWFAAWSKRFVDQPRTQSIQDWGLCGSTFLFVVALYAFNVYPVVRPQFGGGGPRDVTFQLDGPSGPQTIDVLLIEQVDSGYYYILKNEKDDHSTYFLPLDRVQRVTFMSPPFGRR